MTDFSDLLRLYDYALPPELIANAPASPRDSARLLVYNRTSGEIINSVFRDIGTFLPKNALLVLNKTKVIPARLALMRSTGGKVSILSLGVRGERILVMANKKLRTGEFLEIEGKQGFTVEAEDGKHWLLKPHFPLSDLQEIFEAHGTMPLPPYIKSTPLSEEDIRREYQTVFAQEAGSIAAPTASLHFTEALLTSLQEQGIGIAYVTLHVHLGTFAPLTEEQWQKGKLHTEEYVISDDAAEKISSAKQDGRSIVAVGTTAVRTVESAIDESGHFSKLSGSTDLFIRDGYKFKVVDSLITNFHVPRSSLMMLVGEMVGREKLLELYRHAIEERYRFFSFGDAMLII